MPAPANQRSPKLAPATRRPWFCAASAAATSALAMLALAAARLLIPTPSLAAIIGALAFAAGFTASLFKRSLPHGDVK
jgi:hypothetical protein